MSNTISFRYFVYLFLFGLFCSSISAKKITNLPGFNISTLNFSQYSGYIQVQSKPNRYLFYWFVESSNKPAKDPVVLWLNGGPGCSSLDGFWSEHGPLQLDEWGNVYYNQYSWNTVANVIYLESPAGVGFSYSDDGSYGLDDKTTAENAFQFLIGFFQQFPQYSNNDFYISGESYAGHYVVQLSYRVLQGNNNGESNINMKGLLVGNGVTDYWIDGNSYLPYIYTHAFVSDQQYRAAQLACDDNFVNFNSTACITALTVALSNVQDINPYNIYDLCTTTGEKHNMRPHPLGKEFTRRFGLKDQIPCVNSTVETNYLNLPGLQAAVYAKPTTWTVCNLNLNQQYVPDLSVLALYAPLMENYRVLIYSGDVDSAVNYQGTQTWITSLDLEVVGDWLEWKTPDGQNGGFYKVYDQLTFLTIRGAGHMVPQYKPVQGLYFFQKWITNQPF